MKRALIVFRAVASDTFLSGARDRLFTLFAVFAFTAVYASVLAGVMAVDQEARVLSDMGLLLMELTALAYALFSASTTLLREAETKTIYLVFSRPVSRALYLAGKLAGAFMTTALMLAVMAAMHLALLKMRGFGVPAGYGWALAGSFLKIAVITSFAVFVSLFSTSSVSTLVISAIMWTLGHFAPEAGFLAERAGGLRAALLKTALLFIPNLQLLNARDTSGAPAALPAAALLPAAAWVLACYLGSLWLLRRKEF